MYKIKRGLILLMNIYINGLNKQIYPFAVSWYIYISKTSKVKGWKNVLGKF